MLSETEPGEDGRRRIDLANCRETTFVGPVDFSKVRFGDADFSAATFEGDAHFEGALFDDRAQFASATFHGMVSFAGAIFDCMACFEHVEGSLDAGVPGEVSFHRWADFRHVEFRGGAGFGGAEFASRARFDGATFGMSGKPYSASFEGATFARARTFGPLLAWARISLDRASFEAPVRASITSPDISCKHAAFAGRTVLELRSGAVDLADAEFALPSTVAGFGETSGLKPRITSVERANLVNVTLSHLDLSDCTFVGAHGLDGVRFEDVEWATVQNIWGTHRRAIADERALAPGTPAKAERIARAYRALRKGREDNKDEPGAGDLYYGEMEMRRKALRRRGDPPSAKRTSRPEWFVIWLYRLVSGYGLRSSRALFCLTVTVLVFGWALHVGGFKPDQDFGTSVLFSVESTSTLFRGTSVVKASTLTDLGHVLHIGLRVLGPLFLGLAILALRARVKR